MSDTALMNPKIVFIKNDSNELLRCDATVVKSENQCDIYKSSNDPIVIQSNKTSVINTNLSIKVPPDYYIKIILGQKSQNYNNSVYLVNDSIKSNTNMSDNLFTPLNFVVHNNSSCNYNLYNGDKLATLILVKIESYDISFQ